MFMCNPGIPSRVDNQRWLYVISPHRGVRKDITEKPYNKNSQNSIDETHNDDTNAQETVKRTNIDSSNQCSLGKKSEGNIDAVSQYSQETINKIFDESSSQFSQEMNHKPPQHTSSQYSQETISKIFEDDSFETFDESPSNASRDWNAYLFSRPTKRKRSQEMESKDETSDDVSLQISQETFRNIFEEDSFEPSCNSKPSASYSFDDSDDSEYGSVPRLKWKTASTVGKWLLFNDSEVNPVDNLSDHDRAWEKIKSLVTGPSNVDIFSAKCSTNYSVSQFSQSAGVVCCYTEDYRDKLSVKRAADSIRNILRFTCCIYYKTDDATSAGAYQHKGNTAISMYMHTNGNKMYERDENGKWKIFST